MSLRLVILILIVFVLPVSVVGSPISVDSINYFNQKARQMADSANFVEAEQYYQKTIHFCDSTKNWELSLKNKNSLVEIWIIQAAYYKADSLLKQNKRLARKRSNKNKAISTELRYLSAILKFKKGDYREASSIIDQCIKLNQLKNNSDSLQQAKSLELKALLQIELGLTNAAIDEINSAWSFRSEDENLLHKASYHYHLGFYLFKIKDFVAAKKQFAKCLDERLTLLPKYHPLIADCKFWLGKVYLRQDSLQQAKDYTNAALQSKEKVLGNQHPDLSKCNEVLAQIHQQEKNYEIALYYYKMSIQKIKNVFQDGHPQLGKRYNNIAHLYEAKGNYQESYKYYAYALISFEKYYGTTHTYYLNTLSNIASLNQHLGNYKEALKNLEDALTIAENSSAKHDISQKLFYDIAILHFRLKHYNKGNTYFNKIKHLNLQQHIEIAKIHFLNKNYNNAVFSLNSAEIELTQSSLNEQLTYYYWKAKTHYHLYQKNETSNYLDTSVHLIKTCDQIIQQRRKEVGDLMNYNGDIQPVYQLGIDIFKEAFAFKQDTSFINLAFQFINQSKSNTLLQGINENYAMLSDLPENLIQKERKYQEVIAHFEKEKLEVNDSQKDSLDQLLVKRKEAYINFKTDLENDYPLYYQLKYENVTPTIADIQQKINPSTAVLEYFIGDSILYIIYIEKNRQQFIAYPKPLDLIDGINNFRQSINATISKTVDASTVFEQFVHNSEMLYQYLLQETLKNVDPNKINQLIIIPHQQLNYVPFDLLLSETADMLPKNYQQLSYVLKQYAVAYVSSSSFLTDKYSRSKKHMRVNYIGYAPKYENEASLVVDRLASRRVNTRDNYSDLPKARDAVLKIDSMLNNQPQAYIEKAATKAAFIQNVDQAKIHHLAMHASVDEQNPSNSYLIFSDDSLSIADLYTLNIEANLAVLTACNTGTGQLQEGEGVMSLSRAFTYAGCPSLIMSLWSLPDEQTAIISEYFFQYLKEGMVKHQALQQAKLSYLQTDAKSNRLSHPFFWGGLVATGNMDAIFELDSSDSSFSKWLIGLLLLPLLLIGFRFLLVMIRKK